MLREMLGNTIPLGLSEIIITIFDINPFAFYLAGKLFWS
jgi:hypothetical protein